MNTKSSHRLELGHLGFTFALICLLGLAAFSGHPNTPVTKPNETNAVVIHPRIPGKSNAFGNRSKAFSSVRHQLAPLKVPSLASVADPEVESLPIGDFSVSASPSSRTIAQGATTTFTLTVQSLSGFNSSVSFFALNLPPGFVAQGTGWNPASATPPANGTTSSTFTLVTNGSTQTGTFTITLRGTGGGITRDRDVSLTINAPDFSVSRSPSSRTITQGETTTFTLTVQSLNGFNSSVSFFALNLPPGFVAQGTGWNPASATPPANGTTSSTFTLVTSNATQTGTFTITLRGTGGGLTRDTTVSLTINPPAPPDFSVSRSPSSRTITQGETTTFTLTVQSLNGFNSSVSFFALNLPSGFVAQGTGWNPASATPPANGTTSSTFTLVTNGSTQTGTFTITLRGTGGGLTRDTTVSLTINSPADFSVSRSPSSRTITQGETTTFTLTVQSLNGFNSSVSFFALNLPPGFVAQGTGWNPASATPPANGTTSSTFTLVTSNATQTGTFTITLRGTGGGLTRDTTVSLTINPPAPPDFSVSRSPSSRTITQGETTTFTLTVQSLNGFNSSVSFFALNLPPGYVAQGTAWNPASATPPANGSTSSTFTLVTNGSTQTGTFTITLRATGGGLTRDTTVSLTINPAPTPDFTVSASPSSRTITQGATTTFTLTVQSLNGFDSSVSFFALNLPPGYVAQGTAWNPASASPLANGTTNSTFTLVTNGSTQTGTFTITLRGTGGGLTRDTTVSLTINPAPTPDFTVSALPSSRTIMQGENSFYTITVNSVNGFSGSVTLFALNLPGNVVLPGTGFSPQTVTVPSGGSATSTFNYVSNATVPTGTSTVTMQGQGAGLTRSSNVSLVVTQGAGLPTISDASWDSNPSANQPFNGTILGTNFLTPTRVFFCINGTNTCYEHPSIGITVNSPNNIRVINVNLGAGSYQVLLQTSAGPSLRSSAFSVAGGAETAAFVSETFRDGSEVTPGQGFTKTWTIRNNGLTTWSSSYRLRWVSGANLSNHNDVLINGTVPPGGNYTFSIPMTAPTSGHHREDWKFINGSGVTIPVNGSGTIWVDIVVNSPTDAATFVSETIGDDTPMTAGQNFTKSWTVRNSGTTTWNSNYKLRWLSSTGANLSAHNTVSINGSIPPGATYTFSVPMTAPTSTGSYREDWQFINAAGSTIKVGASFTVWASINVGGTSTTQCGSATQMRDRIQQRIQANLYVPTYYPDQSATEALLSLSFPAYEELYHAAFRYRAHVQTTYLLARKFLDQGDLEDACTYIRRGDRLFYLRTQLEGAAALVWDTRVSGSQEVTAEIIRELCKIETSLVHAQFGATAASLMQGACLYVDFAVDKSVYGEDEAIRRLRSNFRDAVISVVLDVGIDELGGQTLAQYMERGGYRYDADQSLFSNYLRTVMRTPAARAKLRSALGNLVQGEAVDRLTDKIIGNFLDGLSGGQSNSPQIQGLYNISSARAAAAEAESPAAPLIQSTNPTRSAAFVNVNFTNIQVEFSEPIHAGNLAITMVDSARNAVNLSNIAVQGKMLTATVVNQFSYRSVYTVIVSAGAVLNEAGVANQEYQWSFFTGSPALTVSANGQIANTGGAGLDLRGSPGIGGNVIALLPEGTRFRVIAGPQQADSFTWWNVTTPSQSGWLPVGDWLVPSDTGGLRIGGVVTVSNTNGIGLSLREQPGNSGTLVTSLPDGTSVTILGGPYLVDGYAWWSVSGVSASGFAPVAKWLMPDISGTSSTNTLTVTSSNPYNIVNIAMSPADINGFGNGTTHFARTYATNANVTLIAPMTFAGGTFQKWQRDSADWSFNPTTSLTLDGNHVMTAVYTAPATVPITIQTSPSGQSFAVDGIAFVNTQTFAWTPGSAHTIQAMPSQDGSSGTRFVWTGWSDNGALTHIVSPISVSTYTAMFSQQLLFTMNSASGGTVLPTSQWVDSGQTVVMQAVPNANHVFGGWSGTGVGSFTGSNNPASVTMGGPITETASFALAPLELLLETATTDQLPALDSVLHLRDPFPVVNPNNSLNQGTDRNTRLVIFLRNLQLEDGETPSSVVVNLIDSNGQSHDVAAEDVRGLSSTNFTQVTFRLPDNIAVGTCTIRVLAHGRTSNVGTVRIRS